MQHNFNYLQPITQCYTILPLSSPQYSTTRPTRSSNCLCLAHPKLTSRLKFFDRSFHNAAPCLWNKLPTTLRSLSREVTYANPVLFPPLPYIIKNFLSISRHIFSLSSFLPRLLLSTSTSAFSTSHCPFLVICLSA